MPERLTSVAATAPIDSLVFLYDVMASRGHRVAAEIEARLGTPDNAADAYAARDAARLGSRLKPLPVFIGHAADDEVVPVARSLRLVEAWLGGPDVTAVFAGAGGHRVVGDGDGIVWRELVRFLEQATRARQARTLTEVST
jgi:pimeloyl-ACP methyl ester carboxylesterase